MEHQVALLPQHLKAFTSGVVVLDGLKGLHSMHMDNKVVKKLGSLDIAVCMGFGRERYAPSPRGIRKRSGCCI
jgi:hypothetical protein